MPFKGAIAGTQLARPSVMIRFSRMGVAAFALFAACGSGAGEPAVERPDSAASDAGRPGASATPAQVTPGQFASLRWIEGTWRGSGIEQPTFYERYTFVDDSTIRAESSPDSTFPDPDEAGAIELRAGRVTTGDSTMLWAVSSIDARSVRFDPVRGARNTFVWDSESDSAWRATLTWTDRDGEAHERIYRMRRMP